MRKSLASIALIQRSQHGRRQWLAQWNEHWQRYSFVGGHKRPDESFRDCMIREIAEELLLGEGRDFLVADRPLARLEYIAWSQSAGQETRYSIELLEVQLQGDTIRISRRISN
jgi:8-oxo-dGTP pyrophosphatase MutT (NUDIX family)